MSKDLKKAILSYGLLIVGYLLAIVGFCLGVREGLPSLILFGLAVLISVISLLEVFHDYHLLYEKVGRILLFWLGFSGIFYNLGVDKLGMICAFMAVLCGLVLGVRFVYFINKYSVPDAEEQLD